MRWVCHGISTFMCLLHAVVIKYCHGGSSSAGQIDNWPHLRFYRCFPSINNRRITKIIFYYNGISRFERLWSSALRRYINVCIIIIIKDILHLTVDCLNCRSLTYIKITLSAMKISMAATLLNMLLTEAKNRRPCLQQTNYRYRCCCCCCCCCWCCYYLYTAIAPTTIRIHLGYKERISNKYKTEKQK